MKWQDAGEKCILMSFITYNVRQVVTKSRRMRWAGYVARMGEKRNAYTLLVEKPDGRKQLERPRHR
jgi:hypothetical protein